MPFDFKKEFKEFYLPKNKPEIVQIPEMKFLAVRGMGDPNVEGGDYQTALGLLYAVAYTLKMSYKTEYKIEGFFEYVVPPLEGFWWQNGINGVDYKHKENFTREKSVYNKTSCKKNIVSRNYGYNGTSKRRKKYATTTNKRRFD